jgi:hypothetical protein
MQFQFDDNAFHLLKRQHNRLEIMIIMVKTLAILSWHVTAAYNMVVFSVLFTAQFLTQPYFYNSVRACCPPSA